MKKICLCFCGWAIFGYNAGAQQDQQTAILTDHGIITVSKTMNNRDKITVAIKDWDEMVAGTKYTSAAMPFFKAKKLCIEIASRKKGNCSTGIGFGCSMYNCPRLTDALVNRVDANSRVCATTIRKIKGSIEIIFLDNVNWKSLAGD
jgi:hypothetical protein